MASSLRLLPPVAAGRIARRRFGTRVAFPFDLLHPAPVNRHLLAFFLPTLLLAQEPIDHAANAKIRSEAADHLQVMHTLHILADRYGPRLVGSLIMRTHSYTKDPLVEQPTVGLFAEFDWTVVSALEETSGATGTLLRETKGEVVLVSRLARPTSKS